MTADIAQLWKQPSFANLNEGVRLHYRDGKATLHEHFAYGLFYMSGALPVEASPETLALETARRVVAFEHERAQQALTANGFITRWTPEQCEAIAREMADLLPRHPGVVQAVENALAERRDEVFADKSLTHGDEMFIVRKIDMSNAPVEIDLFMTKNGIESIKEDFIETIDRCLDHLAYLHTTKHNRLFARLFKKMTSMRRVYAVIQPK